MSSMRIVLVDPLGDILFSGESMIAHPSEEALAAESRSRADQRAESACPATKRSTESGIYRSADPGTVKHLPSAVSEVTDDENEESKAA